MASYRRALRMVVNGLVGLSLLFTSLPVSEIAAAATLERPPEATPGASGFHPLTFGSPHLSAVGSWPEAQILVGTGAEAGPINTHMGDSFAFRQVAEKYIALSRPAKQVTSSHPDVFPETSDFTPRALPLTFITDKTAQARSRASEERPPETADGGTAGEARSREGQPSLDACGLVPRFRFQSAYEYFPQSVTYSDVSDANNVLQEDGVFSAPFYPDAIVIVDYGSIVDVTNTYVKSNVSDYGGCGGLGCFRWWASYSTDYQTWTQEYRFDWLATDYWIGLEYPHWPPIPARYVKIRLQQTGGERPPIDAIKIRSTTLLALGLPGDQTLSKNECPLSACSLDAQHFAGDPINTFSGNYNYQVTDLSIPAAGQPLRFERSYNSMPASGTLVYSRPLGYGWTHDYDVNLTLPDDPGGEANTVILKAHHGSRMRFEEDPPGTYSPYPGVWADMARQGTSAPYTYVVTAANQTVYTFGVLSDSVAVEPAPTTPPAGVTLAPGYRMAAAPGAVFSVTHTLTNTGATTDSYTLTVASQGDWVAVEPFTATLAAGGSTPVTATLSAPLGYGRGAVITAVLTATSWTTPTLAATATESLTLRGYRLLSIRDAQGNATEFDYDSSDYLGRVTDAASQRYLEFDYDAQARLASVSDHTGRSVGYGYDAYDNLTVVTDTRELTWTYAYTTAGGAPGIGHYLNQVTDPDGKIVERTLFDGMGRAYRQYNGEGDLVAGIEYNLDGTRVVTEAGVVVTDTYNGLNLLVSQQDAAGTRSYEFDGFFNRTSVADAKGNDPTRYARNQYGYTQVITDAQGNTTTFEYDDPGTNNLLSMTDARGVVTRYEYEGNRLITTTANYENGVFAPGVPDQDVQTVYTYNARGQVTSVRDPNRQRHPVRVRRPFDRLVY